MATLTLSAPAKLNLFLHIVGKQADGYHQLQTYFQLLNLGDELQFEPFDQLIVNGCEHIPLTSNLVWRAAKALQEQTGCTLGARIHLRKRLPIGGGIGGGSSDAATTLLALNRLWQLDLSTTDLAEIGLRLGADVPVFVLGHSGLGLGIGEQIQPLSQPSTWYLVAWGPDSVSTAHIFQHPRLTHQGLEPTIATAIEQGHNDCQAVVANLYPAIATLLDLLGPNARLTGTGGCVFLPCQSLQQGEALGNQLPLPYRYFVAQGTDVSICHQQLAAL